MRLLTTVLMILGFSLSLEAKSLCDQELSFIKLEFNKYNGSSESKKRLTTVFHTKVPELRQVCSSRQVYHIKKKFASLLNAAGANPEIGQAFEPRKAVIIDTIGIYSRSPASR